MGWSSGALGAGCFSWDVIWYETVHVTPVRLWLRVVLFVVQITWVNIAIGKPTWHSSLIRGMGSGLNDCLAGHTRKWANSVSQVQ